MPLRDIESPVTPQGDAPMTRREARAREAAAAAESSTGTPGTELVVPMVVVPPVTAPALAGTELAVTQQPFSATPPLALPAVASVPPVPEAPRVTAPRFVPSAPSSVPTAARASARGGARKAAAPTRPASRPRSLGAQISRKLLSVGALLFAGALLVGMTVPANAFISDPMAFAPEEIATSTLPAQSIAVPAEAAAEAMGRDSYEVISYAEQLKALYSSSNYTYSVTTGSVRWPFPFVSPYTDGFGARGGSHMGVDFTPGEGSPIYAVADGLVTTHVDDNGSYGNHVIISHNVNGQRVDSLYAHMITGSSPLQPGQPVKVGDFIGLVGNTGQSYGAHLHLEIRLDGIQVDPFAWLATNAN